MKKIAFSYSACHETWKLSHNFNLNYTGSPPGMEIAGATKIFSSYIKLLFMEIATARHILLSKIYMIQVNLLKSLGHYQKHVG